MRGCGLTTWKVFFVIVVDLHKCCVWKWKLYARAVGGVTSIYLCFFAWLLFTWTCPFTCFCPSRGSHEGLFFRMGLPCVSSLILLLHGFTFFVYSWCLVSKHESSLHENLAWHDFKIEEVPWALKVYIRGLSKLAWHKLALVLYKCLVLTWWVRYAMYGMLGLL